MQNLYCDFDYKYEFEYAKQRGLKGNKTQPLTDVRTGTRVCGIGAQEHHTTKGRGLVARR